MQGLTIPSETREFNIIEKLLFLFYTQFYLYLINAKLEGFNIILHAFG